jgi:hypothetical protein
MYFSDASAISNLVRRACLKLFINGVTLDLAIYESVSAVWKEYFTIHRLDEEATRRLFDILRGVFSNLRLVGISGYEKEVS